MLNLVPMATKEYEVFIEISSRTHIASQIEVGYWHPDEAEAKMAAMRQQVIPQDMDTPNHYFYTIKKSLNSTTVGGLWFAVMEREGEKFLFVVDIQIFEAYRRQGFGSQAFLEMETFAHELGVAAIALNVHPQNHSARAMYQKLGYQGSETEMFKRV